MSKLKTLIEESKVKKELTASTIRMPREMYSEIQGLADQFEITKQEVMLSLLEEGISVARTLLKLDNGDDDDIESKEINFYLLNTNKGNRIEDHDLMMEEGIAAAFHDPWKFKIDQIKKGDTVFLYENGTGIVAYGVATGNVKITDHEGYKDERHYQKLERFIVLDKPVSASQIKKILGRNVVFLQTMSSLVDGEKIVDHLS